MEEKAIQFNGRWYPVINGKTINAIGFSTEAGALANRRDFLADKAEFDRGFNEASRG